MFGIVYVRLSDVLIILYHTRKSVLGFVVGGGGNGDKMNNSPYDKVLNASFDKLYDTTDLVEKSITSLYFMFSLLRQYELSFVNYQEGINVNYTKINESLKKSCIKKYMEKVFNYFKIKGYSLKIRISGMWIIDI